MKQERTAYFDGLRVAAILAVMLLHVSSQWMGGAPSETNWQIACVFNCMVRWAVPAFVMISGALFLPREIPTKTIYTKYALRLAVAYVVWSVIYTVPHVLLGKTHGLQILHDCMYGSVHLWFLPMLIGLYLCIPILRQITKSRTVTRYFLALSFVAAFAVPFVFHVLIDFGGAAIGNLAKTARGVYDNMALQTVSGYAFYFVLGDYLNRHKPNAKRRKGLYALGLAGFAVMAVFTIVLSKRSGELATAYIEPISPCAALMAAAVFTLFQARVHRSGALLQALSADSFGAYLVHMLLIVALKYIGITLADYPPLAVIPLATAAVAAASFGISAIIHQIPILNKWIV